MKSKLIAKTLGVLALATMGLTAPAHANDWQDDNDRDYGYSEQQGSRGDFMQQLREGFRFSQIVNDRQDQQLDRIMADVETNRVGKAKFISLMQEQKNIRAMERGYMNDRFMNEAEFQRLSRALDVAQRNIQLASRNHPQYSYSPRPWTNH